MSEIVIFAIFIIAGLCLITNLAFFLANLKLYTEIMKEKSQRERRP